MTFPIPDRVSPSGPLAQPNGQPWSNVVAQYSSVINPEDGAIQWAEELNNFGFILRPGDTEIQLPTNSTYEVTLVLNVTSEEEIKAVFWGNINFGGSPVGLPAAGAADENRESRSTSVLIECSDISTQFLGADFSYESEEDIEFEALLIVKRLL